MLDKTSVPAAMRAYGGSREMRLFRVHVLTPKGTRRFTLAKQSATEAMVTVAKMMNGEPAIWAESYAQDLGVLTLKDAQLGLFDTER